MIVVVVGASKIQLTVERLARRRVHPARRCGRRRGRLFLHAVVNQIAKRRIETMVGQRMPPDAATGFVLFQIRRSVIGSIPEYTFNI